MKKSSAPQIPKYRQIVEHFQQQIEQGVLRPGDRLPSINAMRESQGISRVTMDKVHQILEQEGWVERQQGIGTFVLDKSKFEKKRESKGVIGLAGYGFSCESSSFYWTRLLEGIRAQAEAGGSQILLLSSNEADGWEKADGVLISDLLSKRFRSSIPSTLPMVCLFGLERHWSSIVADEYSGVVSATEHLLALGHRRIAYLHASHTNALPRLQGYEDALREAGIDPQRNWRRCLSGVNDDSAQFTFAGRRDMTLWLSEQGPDGWNQIGCTALLCHNDDAAVGVLQALNAAGLKVPDDVSVVGFDGTQTGEYSLPPLTSVEMPSRRMGEIAVQILQRQIAADETFVEHRILPTQLRVRQSTTAPSNHQDK
jgi:LacI family transcriptional regulator